MHIYGDHYSIALLYKITSILDNYCKYKKKVNIFIRYQSEQEVQGLGALLDKIAEI